MSRASDYVTVCSIASRTNPEVRYEVKQHVATGVVSCGCPSWRFSKGAPEERACKHLSSLAAAGIILGLQPTAQAKAIGGRAPRRIVTPEPQADTRWRQILLDD